MTLAERLAAFAVRLEFEDIPSDVVASVRLRALNSSASPWRPPPPIWRPPCWAR